MGAAVWTSASLTLWSITCLLGAHAKAPTLSSPLLTPGIKQASELMDRRATRSMLLRDHLKNSEALSPVEKVQPFASLMLECEFRGSPPPSIDWLHGASRHSKAGRDMDLGAQAERMSTLLVDNDTEGIAATRSRLYLECITPRDQGQYTCQGSAARLLDRSSSQLFVAGRADKEDMLACEQAKGLPFRPARIVQWRPKMLAKMGGRVRLMCDTIGYPSPSVTWSKDFQTIETDGLRMTVSYGPLEDQLQVTNEGDLIIDNLQWSDMGLYQCDATNEFATDSVTSFLYPFKS